jgi:hypothetical protein
MMCPELKDQLAAIKLTSTPLTLDAGCCSAPSDTFVNLHSLTWMGVSEAKQMGSAATHLAYLLLDARPDP